MNEKEALLNQLRSVHVPEVSGVPAMGWWILLLALIVLAAVWRLWRKRRQARLWQREANGELARIRESIEQHPASITLSDTSKLARRVLLKTKGRQAVASLHGAEWLKALDDVAGRSLFADGFGSLLESSQYQRDPHVNPSDLHSLMDAMDELIRSSARSFK